MHIARKILALGERDEAAVDKAASIHHRLLALLRPASKETSSSSFSITVYSREPMFSVFSFTWQAISARRRMPSAATQAVTPSVASRASYWRVRQASVLGEDALEVLDRQRLELDADREAPCSRG